jgi:NADH-quinone oxidoreductase subunit A
MTNSALFLVVLLTAVIMVVAALLIAWLVAPKSNNPVKGEPYECGIPTRGTSWTQFKVGYYLFAILYLVFDVETVLLFPWASIMKDLGTQGLICMAFFFVILTLGLAYAWKKGALKWK